jgi:hypothetical protein
MNAARRDPGADRAREPVQREHDIDDHESENGPADDLHREDERRVVHRVSDAVDRGSDEEKVFLVVEHLSVHEAAAVDQWLADKADRIEVFYLPKYAPERNPDEHLNCDVKANMNADGLPKDREELKGKLQQFMQKLAKLPARVAGDFEHNCISYAAAPQLNPT